MSWVFRFGSLTAWAWCLFLLYALALLVCVAHLWMIWRGHHALRSYHSAFLLLSGAWLPLRALIMVVSSDASRSPVLVAAYMLPTSLQFAAFSLWVLFMSRASNTSKNTGGAVILQPNTSGNLMRPSTPLARSTRGDYCTCCCSLACRRRQRCPVITWYVVSNVLMVFLNLTEIALMGVFGTYTPLMQQFQAIVRGFAYTLLVALLIFYGYRFSQLTRQQYRARLLPRRPAVLTGCNIALGILFACRAVYDFWSIVRQLPHLPQFPPLVASNFTFFVAVEVCPLGILLMAFKMPSSGAVGRQNSSRFEPYNARTRGTLDSLDKHMFGDDGYAASYVGDPIDDDPLLLGTGLATPSTRSPSPATDRSYSTVTTDADDASERGPPVPLAAAATATSYATSNAYRPGLVQ